MVLVITLQTDLNSSHHDNKGTTESPRSIKTIKRCKTRTLYYANTVYNFNIILHSDINKNPGSDFHTHKCDMCKSTEI